MEQPGLNPHLPEQHSVDYLLIACRFETARHRFVRFVTRTPELCLVRCSELLLDDDHLFSRIAPSLERNGRRRRPDIALFHHCSVRSVAREQYPTRLLLYVDERNVEL